MPGIPIIPPPPCIICCIIACCICIHCCELASGAPPAPAAGGGCWPAGGPPPNMPGNMPPIMPAIMPPPPAEGGRNGVKGRSQRRRAIAKKWDAGRRGAAGGVILDRGEIMERELRAPAGGCWACICCIVCASGINPIFCIFSIWACICSGVGKPCGIIGLPPAAPGGTWARTGARTTSISRLVPNGRLTSRPGAPRGG